jgi:hypothetical protein
VLAPLLACLVEGAWIAVVDAVFGAGSRRQPLGPLVFGLIAAVAWLWVRSAPADAERPGLVVIMAAAFLGCGWLALGSRLEQNVVAIAVEPASWLGAVAAFRGTTHRSREDDDLVVGSLLRWGIPLLVVPWLVSVALPPGTRSTFVTTAFPSTLLFAAGGLLALGLSRLEALSAASGLDWRRNRAWLLLLLGVVLLVVAIAVPAAFLLGEPVTAIVAGLWGPFAAILTPIVALVVFLLTPIFDFLQGLMRFVPQPLEAGAPFGGASPSPGFLPPEEVASEPNGFIALLGILFVISVIGGLLILLARGVRRRTDGDEIELQQEEHEFLLPTIDIRLPRLSLPEWRGGRPGSATGAYLAFLGDAARAGPLARDKAEGPQTHVRRIRGEGLTEPAAGKLVADYELERYGLRRLPARETQRAVSRWRRLREVLRSRRRDQAD